MVLEFFAKVNDDPNWRPSKHTGTERGVDKVGGMLCWKRTRNDTFTAATCSFEFARVYSTHTRTHAHTHTHVSARPRNRAGGGGEDREG